MSIKSIGKKLKRNESLSEEEKEEFDSFRQDHNRIIDLFNIELKKLLGTKINYQIASRNKRVETIIDKLRRPNSSKLERIQDIAGCRIIVENKNSLLYILNKLDGVQILGDFVNTKKYNYIENPKKDGYRSVHYVFSYSQKKDRLYNKKIELQVRTNIQHIWATTLEIYDIIDNSNIKSGTYNKLKTWEGLFFKRCSLIFEGVETNNRKTISKNINKIFKNKHYIKIFERIKKIDIVQNITLPKTLKKNEKLILITYTKEKRTTFFTTDSEDANSINAVYRMLEEKNNNGDYILLLLTLEDIKKLKETYPNYFFKTKTFIEYLEKLKKEEDELWKK